MANDAASRLRAGPRALSVILAAALFSALPAAWPLALRYPLPFLATLCLGTVHMVAQTAVLNDALRLRRPAARLRSWCSTLACALTVLPIVSLMVSASSLSTRAADAQAIPGDALITRLLLLPAALLPFLLAARLLRTLRCR